MLRLSLLMLVALVVQHASAYDVVACCNIAKVEGQFRNTTEHPLPDPANQTCGQLFDASIPAAPDLFVSYEFCASRCGGIGVSMASDTGQWAAPLVQFILPSVIFSMVVPRRKKIEFTNLFDYPRVSQWAARSRFPMLFGPLRLLLSLLLSVIIMIPVMFDTILWIIVIAIGAGNMLVGGLYEAHLDYRVVKRVQSPIPVRRRTQENMTSSIDDRTELLVTVVAGNLIIDPRFESPKTEICNSLSSSTVQSKRNEQRRVRLLAMLGSQDSFGSAVGAPVIFYLGAFVYTILDLQTDPSSEDSAIGIAFGVEWMIIVHVAIISSCLLASNNPSTSSAIVGHNPLPEAHAHRAPTIDVAKANAYQQRFGTARLHPEEEKLPFFRRALLDPASVLLGWSDAYETKFQPVWIWNRGLNKMQWIQSTSSWASDDRGFRNEMRFTAWGWLFKIFIPTLLLIALPPATGAVVAYYTPPVGFGCRSLSFVVYAACQAALTVIATLQNATNSATVSSRFSGILDGVWFWICCTPFLAASFLALIGGTLMQIIGVYRNCICYIQAQYWLHPSAASPGVNLASDTINARISSQSWLILGSVATGFMVFTCYAGWWYQRLIRHRFVDTVEDIFQYGNDDNRYSFNSFGGAIDSSGGIPNQNTSEYAGLLRGAALSPSERAPSPDSSRGSKDVAITHVRTLSSDTAVSVRDFTSLNQAQYAPVIDVELEDLTHLHQ